MSDASHARVNHTKGPIWWRRWCVLAALVVICAAAGFLFARHAAEIPALDVARAYDFGAVPEGAVLDHEFTFTNRGPTPLHLTLDMISCGCTTAGFDNPTIEPGTSSRLKVVLQAGSEVGQKNVTLLITATSAIVSNTPPKSIVLKLIATVRGDVGVFPGMIELGNVRRGTPSRKAIVKVVTEDPTAHPQSVKWPGNNFHQITASWDNSNRVHSGHEFDLNIWYDPNVPNLPAGEAIVAGQIVMEGSRGLETLEIPVRATVVDEVAAEPAAIYWGADRQESVLVKITAYDGTDLTITNVAFSDQAYSHTVSHNGSSEPHIAVIRKRTANDHVATSPSRVTMEVRVRRTGTNGVGKETIVQVPMLGL